MYEPDKIIAKKLGLTCRGFRRLFYGRIKYEKIDQSRYYDYDEIVKLIKENKNE